MANYGVAKKLEIWLVEGHYKEPESYYTMKRETFEWKSNTYWASGVVVQELLKNRDENPIFVLEQLISKANDFCCNAKTESASLLFGALTVVAEDALDFFICHEYGKQRR